tara:strand:+ start:4474 stop:4998 length:525 start_codon:yes stop_codon:yes gene_type:complete
MEKLEKQPCGFCHRKTLTLIEDEKEIPYFGKCFIFSMSCSNCNFNKSDIESAERKDPSKYTFIVKNKKDLDIRIIKSSEATIKIPELKVSVTPGPASEGYISNIEGILKRFKKIVEQERDSTDDNDAKKKAKNLLKKFWKAECGDLSIKVIIEDPSGNSAIISKEAKVEKIKGK